MTKKELCHIVNKTVRENAIKSTKYNDLCELVEKLGYVLIEFDPLVEDKDIDQLIYALDIDRRLLNNYGFTYVKDKYRLIFIDDRLSEQEKRVVLSHEIGHIVLGHMKKDSVLGTDVLEENDATIFGDKLLRANANKKIYMIMLTVISSILLGIGAALLIKNNGGDAND